MEEFKRRMGESFPSVYLTIISIIQGVALGLLAKNTFEYIKTSGSAELWLRFLPYSVMSFLIIIIVSYEYTWLVGIFRWSPKFLDVIIPFVIGLSEIGPMFYLVNPKIWWFLAAAFCFFGGGGLLNTRRNCKCLMFGENRQAYNRVRNALKLDIIIAFISVPICIFAGVIHSPSMKKVLYWHLYEILFLIFFFGIAIFLLCKDDRLMKNLHSDFGVIR
jgi:hypothetical protein